MEHTGLIQNQPTHCEKQPVLFKSIPVDFGKQTGLFCGINRFIEKSTGGSGKVNETLVDSKNEVKSDNIPVY